MHYMAPLFLIFPSGEKGRCSFTDRNGYKVPNGNGRNASLAAEAPSCHPVCFSPESGQPERPGAFSSCLKGAMKRPVASSILRRVHFYLEGRNSCSRGFLQSQRLARSRGPGNPY